MFVRARTQHNQRSVGTEYPRLSRHDHQRWQRQALARVYSKSRES